MYPSTCPQNHENRSSGQQNVTGTLLIVAATEKEELGLTIDIIRLNKVQVFALDDFLLKVAYPPQGN